MSALALVFATLGGISLLKNTYYLKAQYFGMQIDYMKEKIAYEEYSYGSLGAWISNWMKGNVSEASSEGTAQSVPVLLYHGVITTPGWKSDGTNISLDDFRAQMFAIKKAGYHSITLAQFSDFMQSGKPVPAKSVLITFDDGRSDSYYPVDPLLKVLDYHAVMFVITGRSIGSADSKSTFHLSEDELKKMLASGHWEMASHTQNGHGFNSLDANGTQGHFLSDKMWLAAQNRLETDDEYTQRISADLSASKKDLENALGVKVLGFAYPFGDYGSDSQNFPASKDILNKTVNALFPLAFRQVNESEYPSNYPGKDFRLVKRIDSNSDLSTDKLLFMLDSSQEKHLPYGDTFSGNSGWLTAWGNSELKNGLLLTRASATEDSSMTFLNGTFDWTNYKASANVRLLQGNSFAAVARFINGNNYVMCDFSGGDAALSQMIGGKENAISSSDNNVPTASDQNMDIGIGVSGNVATCYIGNTPIASGAISPSLNHGGVGFKTWDENVNNSSLLVSDLKVEQAQ